jgi:phage-related protein
MAGFGGSVKLTGESEYKKALKDITSNLKLVSSELKLTNTQFNSGDKTLKQTKTSYDSMSKTLEEQKKKVSTLREALAQAEKEYGSNNEKVKTFKTQLNNAENQLKKMENATDKSTKELKEMKDGFNDAGQGALKFGDILKANVIGDFIIDGIKKVGSAVVDMGKQAIAGFGEFEQLEGGVKKLFGNDMTTVIKNANDAYKTAGMSTNEYMETVTSFSASLINSLKGNTKEATKYADMAIRDMSDNANTFGTDIGMIQNAYQGFAKGNYTMLDNLKLGYGGTKSEMERLLKEAEKMPEAMGRKFDMSNYADIVQAINVVQQNMKITGTTFNEASGTIEGSISSMKSAWENWLSGLANGDADLTQLTQNLADSVTTVIENLKPVIAQVVSSIGEVIGQALEDNLPEGVFNTLKNGFQWVIDNKDLLIAGIVGIATALGTLNVVSMITGIVEAFKAWKLANEGVTISQMLLNTVMSLNPVGLIIAGIAGLVAGLIALWNTNEGFRNSCIAVWENIKTAFTTVWGAITEFFTVKVPEIVNNVIEFFKKLPEWFNELPGKIGYALGFAIGKIIQWGVDTWNYLVTNVPKWISNIGKFFSELPGKIWTWLLNTINKVVAWGRDMAQKGKQGAQDLFNNVVNTIKGLPGKMLEMGKNIVEGLWNGISNMAGWIYDKISGFCSGVVDGVKSALGIHSPSKVFEQEVGKNMALGLGTGFAKSMSSVTKDMQRAIPTEFDTNATINGIGSSGSFGDSNYNLMVNAFKEALTRVKVVMDDREMGTFVTDTIEKVVFT